jgi:hypothetical protein
VERRERGRVLSYRPIPANVSSAASESAKGDHECLRDRGGRGARLLIRALAVCRTSLSGPPGKMLERLARLSFAVVGPSAVLHLGRPSSPIETGSIRRSDS